MELLPACAAHLLVVLAATVGSGCASCPCGAGATGRGPRRLRGHRWNPQAPGQKPRRRTVAALRARARNRVRSKTPLLRAPAPNHPRRYRRSWSRASVCTSAAARTTKPRRRRSSRRSSRASPDFRRCYVHVEQPGKGGTFGVDLFVDRDGGKAEVRQPRTGMSGENFGTASSRFSTASISSARAPVLR